MQYQGGKAIVGKHIGPIIAELALGRTFHEPFVGGFNIVPRLSGAPALVRCYDIHDGLVMMYQALQAGWVPPSDVSEDAYIRMRNSVRERGYVEPVEVFTAFACSFGAKEWGGYARSGDKNFAAIGVRSLARKVAHMGGVLFASGSYVDVVPEPGDVIYCDPPYKGTLQYRVGGFDSGAFFAQCETWARNGATVLVSEFQGPEGRGWDVLWRKARKTSIRKASCDTDLETLYRVSVD